MPGIHFSLAFLILICGALGGGFWVTRRLGSKAGHLPVTVDWIEELSAERYRPMARLLEQDEAGVLDSQAGITRRRAACFRAQRAELFRGYLRCLNADFQRASMAIYVLMVQSRDDRPDLARMLIRRRVSFAAAMAATRARLFFYERGICHVDTSSLMRVFEALRVELCTLLPARRPTGA